MEETTFYWDFRKNLKNSVHRWRTLLSLCVLLFSQLYFSQLYQVAGTCTMTLGTAIYAPASTTNSLSTSRMAVVYPAAQLSGLSGQQLTALYLKKMTAADMVGTPNLKIYLKETTISDFGSAALDWSTVSTGATMVYDGDLGLASVGTAGWKQLVFNNNFTYSGANNLIVLFEYVNTGNTVNSTWEYEYISPCVVTSNNNTSKYINTTDGILGSSLSSSNYRRPFISFDYLVSCPATTVPTITGVTSNGFTATWTAGGSETNWDYAVVPTGSGVPTTFTNTTSTSITLSTLTPTTTYDFYVRANCGGGNGVSVWKGPVSFTTLCVPYVPTYTNDFSTFPGSCWKLASGGDPSTGPGTGTTFTWVADGFLNNGTTGAARVNLYTTSRKEWLISPTFNLSAGGYRVKFSYGSTAFNSADPIPAWGSDDYVQFVYSTDNGSTWTVLKTWNNSNLPSNSEQIYIQDLTAITGSQVIFAIYATDGSVDDLPDYDFFVDNFIVETTPACAEPTTGTISSITSDSALVSWTAPSSVPSSGYEIYYSTTSTAPAAGATPSITSISGVSQGLSTLSSNTRYYVWVRSNCGATKSEWLPLGNFKTLCAPIAYMYENFDSYATGAALPDCWVRLYTAGTLSIVSTTTPNSGTRHINQATTSTSTGSSIAILPEFSNVSAGTHRLRFKAKIASSAPGSLEVGYITDVTDANTFVTLQSLTINNTAYTAADAEYIVVPFAGLPANARLGIKNSIDAKSYFYDDVYWEPIPTCFPPTGVTISSITHDTAQINWVAPTTVVPSGYEIYYSTTNTVPTSTTVPTVTGITGVSHILNSLTPNTTYYVWVRSACTGSDRSAWTAIETFKTDCASINYMYENFDSYATGTILPDCWIRLYTAGTLSIVSTTTPNSGARHINQATTSSSTGSSMAILPKFSNIGAGTNRLRFKAKVASASVSGTLEVGYITDVTDVNTFVTLQNVNINNTDYSAPDSEYVVIPPAGLPSNARLAIKNSIDAKSYFYDDVYWEPVPTCYPPTNVVVTGITHNSATVSWTAPTAIPATSYDVYYSTSATAPTPTTTPNHTNVSGTSQVLSSLNSSTGYNVWVRSSCGAGGVSIWTLVKSFSTECLPPTLLSTNGATVCQGGSATLTASASSGIVKWFDASTGGTQLGTGTSFATPNLTTTTNYWVEASSGGTKNVGPTTPASLGTSTATNTSWDLLFTVNTGLMLDSVDVFPGTVGAAGTIEILTASGTPVSSVSFTTTVSGASTPQTVALNVVLPPGDYAMRRSGAANLHRNSVGAVFPYTTPELVITGTTFGPSGYPQYYFYFYNLKFTSGCSSPRSMVTATVDPTCLGTSEVVAKKDNTIYPNPFTDVINISKVEDVKSATVVDASGRVVKTITEVSRTVNLAELKEGLYILTIKYKDGTTSSHKIIKK